MHGELASFVNSILENATKFVERQSFEQGDQTLCVSLKEQSRVAGLQEQSESGSNQINRGEVEHLESPDETNNCYSHDDGQLRSTSIDDDNCKALAVEIVSIVTERAYGVILSLQQCEQLERASAAVKRKFKSDDTLVDADFRTDDAVVDFNSVSKDNFGENNPCKKIKSSLLDSLQTKIDDDNDVADVEGVAVNAANEERNHPSLIEIATAIVHDVCQSSLQLMIAQAAAKETKSVHFSSPLESIREFSKEEDSASQADTIDLDTFFVDIDGDSCYDDQRFISEEKPCNFVMPEVPEKNEVQVRNSLGASETDMESELSHMMPSMEVQGDEFCLEDKFSNTEMDDERESKKGESIVIKSTSEIMCNENSNSTPMFESSKTDEEDIDIYTANTGVDKMEKSFEPVEISGHIKETNKRSSAPHEDLSAKYSIIPDDDFLISCSYSLPTPPSRQRESNRVYDSPVDMEGLSKPSTPMKKFKEEFDESIVSPFKVAYGDEHLLPGNDTISPQKVPEWKASNQNLKSPDQRVPQTTPGSESQHHRSERQLLTHRNLFPWKMSFDVSDAQKSDCYTQIEQSLGGNIPLPRLPECNKQRRLGLSRRHRVRALHPSFKNNSPCKMTSHFEPEP